MPHDICFVRCSLTSLCSARIPLLATGDKWPAKTCVLRLEGSMDGYEKQTTGDTNFLFCWKAFPCRRNRHFTCLIGLMFYNRRSIKRRGKNVATHRAFFGPRQDLSPRVLGSNPFCMEGVHTRTAEKTFFFGLIHITLRPRVRCTHGIGLFNVYNTLAHVDSYKFWSY